MKTMFGMAFGFWSLRQYGNWTLPVLDTAKGHKHKARPKRRSYSGVTGMAMKELI